MSYQYSIFDDCFVDSFAGGGGASTGIEMATGHPVDVAINHNEAAIMMHQRNHPFTEHYIEDIWQVDPKTAVRGRHVRLAWFSPDCKHFSRAKGAALVDKNIRGLAWVVLKWAAEVRPDVIMLENVPEFTTWGPVRKGKPVKSKAGQTYLIQYHTEQSAKEVRGQGLEEPIQTVDGSNRYGLSAAWLTQYFGGEGHYHSVEKPLATITTMEREGTQLDYFNKRMAEIFPTSGFPQQFFDDMLGAVEEPVFDEQATAKESRSDLTKSAREAIKEFAERLKPKVDCEYGDKFYRDKCFEEIDNLVKEMTEGEPNGSK